MTNVTTSGKTEANTMPTGFSYRCAECGRTFKRYTSYIRHIKIENAKHHS
ncbi:MAG: C2H2-type zinc finger protein [Candidatus Izemoplasmatales bacterium]